MGGWNERKCLWAEGSMLKLTKKISSITCLYVIMHLGIEGGGGMKMKEIGSDSPFWMKMV